MRIHSYQLGKLNVFKLQCVGHFGILTTDTELDNIEDQFSRLHVIEVGSGDFVVGDCNNINSFHLVKLHL